MQLRCTRAEWRLIYCSLGWKSTDQTAISLANSLGVRISGAGPAWEGAQTANEELMCAEGNHCDDHESLPSYSQKIERRCTPSNRVVQLCKLTAALYDPFLLSALRYAEWDLLLCEQSEGMLVRRKVNP
eukprot:525767-Pleurochrysis_carterae.AAC.1